MILRNDSEIKNRLAEALAKIPSRSERVTGKVLIALHNLEMQLNFGLAIYFVPAIPMRQENLLELLVSTPIRDKVKVAEAHGLLSPDLAKGINRLFDQRNHFAHPRLPKSPVGLALTDQEIDKMVAEAKAFEEQIKASQNALADNVFEEAIKFWKGALKASPSPQPSPAEGRG